MTETIINFDTICRLCLKENSAAVNIIPKFATDDSSTNIPITIQIMSCIALEVMEIDKLPKAICLQCRYQLEQCYSFKKRCQAADTKLRQHINLISARREEGLQANIEFDGDYSLLQERLDNAFETQNIHERNVIKQMQLELEEYKLSVERTCKRELKEAYKKRLRQEFEVEIRKKLKGELMAEIREECHEEELQRVIKGMEIFLRSEKGKFRRYLKRKQDNNNDSGNSKKSGGILTLSSLKQKLVRAGYSVEKQNSVPTESLFTKVDDPLPETKTHHEIDQQQDENSNSTISAVDESNIIVSDLKPEELDEFILTEYDEDEENEEETFDMYKNGETYTEETIEIPQNVVAYTIDLSDMSLPDNEDKKRSKAGIRLHRLPIEYKSWLRLEKEGFKCKICKIPIKGNRYHIKRHADTAKHRTLYGKLVTSMSPVAL